jgi:hypothetical protein
MKSHLDISRVAFDPKTPMVDESAFNNGANWKEFYGEVQEELPPKMPKPWRQRVSISALMLTMPETKLQDVCTQVLSFMFRILQFFGTVKVRIRPVEAATFGSEMVALWICKELIVAMCYKLRLFGVEIDGPANVFCDYHGVVKNLSVPESMLMKKQAQCN